MHITRRKAITLAVVGAVLLTLAIAGPILAVTMFSEKLAGIGSAQFVDEVAVEKIKVQSLTKVRVRLGTTVNTVADRVYTVQLYGDDTLLASMVTSWSAADIAGNVKKDVAFTGLSLGAVTLFDVDVVY